MAESPFVSVTWLSDHLNDADLRVIDVRGHVRPACDPPPHYFSHREDYEASHIPGAVFVDWTRDIVDPDSRTGMFLAPPDTFAALMGRLGVGDETTVVAYDDANGMFAARIWWALQAYGHERVYVLAGGWPAWVAAGVPTTDLVPQPDPAQFTVRQHTGLRLDADAVQAALGDPDVTLIDVRAPGEYAGLTSRVERAGHIPGAVNLPRGLLLDESGRLVPLDQVRDLAAGAGIALQGQRLITYCNAGVSASYVMMALHAAGAEAVAVYDGSWKDWATDDARPIVSQPDP